MLSISGSKFFFRKRIEDPEMAKLKEEAKKQQDLRNKESEHKEENSPLKREPEKEKILIETLKKHQDKDEPINLLKLKRGVGFNEINGHLICMRFIKDFCEKNKLNVKFSQYLDSEKEILLKTYLTNKHERKESVNLNQLKYQLGFSTIKGSRIDRDYLKAFAIKNNIRVKLLESESQTEKKAKISDSEFKLEDFIDPSHNNVTLAEKYGCSKEKIRKIRKTLGISNNKKKSTDYHGPSKYEIDGCRCKTCTISHHLYQKFYKKANKIADLIKSNKEFIKVPLTQLAIFLTLKYEDQYPLNDSQGQIKFYDKILSELKSLVEKVKCHVD